MGFFDFANATLRMTRKKMGGFFDYADATLRMTAHLRVQGESVPADKMCYALFEYVAH